MLVGLRLAKQRYKALEVLDRADVTEVVHKRGLWLSKS
jgi:hypothetical protein